MLVKLLNRDGGCFKLRDGTIVDKRRNKSSEAMNEESTFKLYFIRAKSHNSHVMALVRACCCQKSSNKCVLPMASHKRFIQM